MDRFLVNQHDDLLPPFPHGGVMVIAHNVDAVEKFKGRLDRKEPHGGRVKTMAYWSGMYTLLDAAGIRRQECFFTNVFVGLKAGCKPEGSLRVGRNADFRAWCSSFLAEQVREMRPRTIAVMGVPAWRFLGGMAPDLSGWLSPPVPAAAIRTTIGGHAIVAVPLLHPSGQGRFMHVRGYRTVGQALDEEVRPLRLAAAR
ncbi:MAG TPA: uracil-DNA glycosylase family protein [Candidatus Limnocylindrales bacterium]|nr:uracil-DNA glycosylase family protein [Candidatus Limnocylindrales bacterium]